MTNPVDFAAPAAQREVLRSPREDNKLRFEDRAAHDWYRFVLSFPAHLVRTYIERFELEPKHTVLDPFCGTGTTLVECKKLGIPSHGIESNPMASFASRTKLDWDLDPECLIALALPPKARTSTLTNSSLKVSRTNAGLRPSKPRTEFYFT